MEWWEELFDQDYVDAWTDAGAFDASDEQAAGILRVAGLGRGDRVLDVPCGFGRIAGRLHAQGIDVTGIDVSPIQIRLAEERHPGPSYEVGDMRRPPRGPFDAVVNWYSSFGYFDDPDDDRAALSAWAAVLRPGGTLLLETMHRDRVANLFGSEPVETPSVREVGATDWVTGIRTATVAFRGRERSLRIRLYTATELVSMTRAAGFSSVEVYGGVDQEPLTPSTRLLLVAKR